jgi:large subunit ribosomal protein L21
MYAVIKTGGKQYRVQPGDVLVVEKLAGEPGDKVAFDQVLMVGEGEAVTVGAPVVADASVSATFIETRKGEKVKIFKKIRRQGYRRTRGHRQFESVLRVTSIVGGGKTEAWDGEVDLTPLSVLNLRARNLTHTVPGQARDAEIDVETVVEPEGKGKTPRVRAKVVESSESFENETAPDTTEDVVADAKPAAKKPAAKKAGGAPKDGFKNTANAKAPKQTRSQAKSPVRRNAPRSGKG